MTGGLAGLLGASTAKLRQSSGSPESDKPVQQRSTPPPADIPDKRVSVKSAPAAKTTSNLPNRYIRKGAGFEIYYPDGWVTIPKTEHGVLIRPQENAEPGETPTIAIQNLLHSRHGGSYSSLGQLYGNTLEQLSEAGKDVVFEVDKAYRHPGPQGDLKGAELVATFTAAGGARIRQRAILLARHQDQGFHLWTYTANTGVYDANKSTADEVLGSWRIHP